MSSLPGPAGAPEQPDSLAQAQQPRRRRWGWPAVALLVVVVLVVVAVKPGHVVTGAKTVMVYAAQDQVYAEPILREFTAATGIRVRAVYDSEAVKTVGLANRLLAERHRPQCDVFWGNEELRTRQLAAAGVFRPSNGWAAFGYRSRRLVFRSLAAADVGGPTDPPGSLLELTNTVWRRRVSLAYPLFGSTSTHFMALRQHWGPARWEAWCRALAANQPFLEEGNSHVVRRLARGEALVGLTDSDDIAAAQREGLAIGQVLPLQPELLLIPNTVAVIHNAPHPDSAQRLFEFLQQPAVVAQLVAVHALEGMSPAEVTVLTLRPDWDALLRDLDAATEAMRRIFLR